MEHRFARKRGSYGMIAQITEERPADCSYLFS